MMAAPRWYVPSRRLAGNAATPGSCTSTTHPDRHPSAAHPALQQRLWIAYADLRAAMNVPNGVELHNWTTDFVTAGLPGHSHRKVLIQACFLTSRKRPAKIIYHRTQGLPPPATIDPVAASDVVHTTFRISKGKSTTDRTQSILLDDWHNRARSVLCGNNQPLTGSRCATGDRRTCGRDAYFRRRCRIISTLPLVWVPDEVQRIVYP